MTSVQFAVQYHMHVAAIHEAVIKALESLAIVTAGYIGIRRCDLTNYSLQNIHVHSEYIISAANMQCTKRTLSLDSTVAD